MAVTSYRLSERVPIPAPAFFFVAAVLSAYLVPAVHAPRLDTVVHLVAIALVAIALVAILFDGGMQIGWGRFRAAAGSISVIGVAGTFLTTAAMARKTKRF